MLTPCDDWIDQADVEACTDLTGVAQPVIDSSITAASQWMFNTLGRRWPGTCTTTERPCGCGCCQTFFPAFAGEWAAWYGYYGSCGCGVLCGCTSEDVVETTYGPISGTPVVTINGTGFSSFVVIPPNRLVRTDGNAWPSCQESYQTNQGWTIEYEHGEAPPELAKLATADLAAELITQCTAGDCKLPPGTTSVTRAGGVTIQLDPQTAGRALPRVALALSAWPTRSAQPDVRVPGKRAVVTAGPA